MTQRQVLVAAAKQLEEKGWCRGAFRDPVGRQCLLGAVNAVFIEDGQDPYNDGWKLRQAVLKKVATVLGTSCTMPLNIQGWGMLTSWNDKPERTKEDVISVLRKAARL